MKETDATWKAIREELANSLSRLEGVGKEKAIAYLESIEGKMLAVAAMTPEQAREAMDDLGINARADLYILGVNAETESARVVVFAIKLATGLLRASIGVV